MFSEINDFANMLCKMTNSALEEIVRTEHDSFPFFLFFTVRSCYVKYDTQEGRITDVSIYVIEKDSFIIEIDPIGGYIRGIVGGEIGSGIKMKRNVADTLLACVRQCWNSRLSSEELITVNGDNRYIAADLIE